MGEAAGAEQSGGGGGGGRNTEQRDVSASEVAAYAYCAKAWHLERVRRVPPTAASRRVRGEGVARHDAHGASVVRLRKFGRPLAWATAALLLLAAALVVAAIVTGRR